MLSRLPTRSYRSFTLVTILLTASSGASGPHLALSAARRSTSSSTIVTLDVGLSPGESRLTAMQWDLSYIPTHLVPTGSPFYTTGPAAKASGKETTCRLVSAGDVRCILVGMNTSVINPGKIASLISQNYRRVFCNSVKEIKNLPETYHRLQLVTDYVCGMTDSFAKDLHSELFNG